MPLFRFAGYHTCMYISPSPNAEDGSPCSAALVIHSAARDLHIVTPVPVVYKMPIMACEDMQPAFASRITFANCAWSTDPLPLLCRMVTTERAPASTILSFNRE